MMDCVIQSHVSDKPVKCYSESDGDSYLADVGPTQQLAGAQMTCLTEVSCVVAACVFDVIVLLSFVHHSSVKSRRISSSKLM